MSKPGSAADDRSQASGAGDGERYAPLAPEQWKEKLKNMKDIYVMKFPRIWQSLIYLLKYKSREEICECDTNKMDWKKVKLLLKDDDLFQRMGEYWPFGSKEENYK